MEEEIVETVTKIVADELSRAAWNIRPTDRPKDDLGADSLDVTDIIIAVQHRYGIVIPEEEWSSRDDLSIKEIASLIKKRLDLMVSQGRR
ncbi:MAG TPA: phosphopantetheine-binding protein [Candidatus Saccharimonadales bacterium]|nr:phosphopantetheine-binding protein [Candidatus Saccharimonadales bacterium]